MGYVDFMRMVNKLLSEGMPIKWTLNQIKKESIRFGVKLDSDMEIIQLIEIAKNNYKVDLF